MENNNISNESLESTTSNNEMESEIRKNIKYNKVEAVKTMIRGNKPKSKEYKNVIKSSMPQGLPKEFNFKKFKKKFEAMNEIFESEIIYFSDMVMWETNVKDLISTDSNITVVRRSDLFDVLFRGGDKILNLHSDIIEMFVELNQAVWPRKVKERYTKFDLNEIYNMDYYERIGNLPSILELENLDYTNIYLAILKKINYYKDYMYSLPRSEYELYKEYNSNETFKKGLDKFFEENSATNLGLKHFLYRPPQKLARYGMLFKSLYKDETNSMKKKNIVYLQKKFMEFNMVVDGIFGEINKQFEVFKLNKNISYSNEVKKPVPLSLHSKDTKIIKLGKIILLTKEFKNSEYKDSYNERVIIILNNLILICKERKDGNISRKIICLDPHHLVKTIAIDEDFNNNTSDGNNQYGNYKPLFLVEKGREDVVVLLFRDVITRGVYKRIINDQSNILKAKMNNEIGLHEIDTLNYPKIDNIYFEKIFFNKNDEIDYLRDELSIKEGNFNFEVTESSDLEIGYRKFSKDRKITKSRGRSCNCDDIKNGEKSILHNYYKINQHIWKKTDSIKISKINYKNNQHDFQVLDNVDCTILKKAEEKIKNCKTGNSKIENCLSIKKKESDSDKYLAKPEEKIIETIVPQLKNEIKKEDKDEFDNLGAGSLHRKSSSNIVTSDNNFPKKSNERTLNLQKKYLINNYTPKKAGFEKKEGEHVNNSKNMITSDNIPKEAFVKNLNNIKYIYSEQTDGLIDKSKTTKNENVNVENENVIRKKEFLSSTIQKSLKYKMMIFCTNEDLILIIPTLKLKNKNCIVCSMNRDKKKKAAEKKIIDKDEEVSKLGNPDKKNNVNKNKHTCKNKIVNVMKVLFKGSVQKVVFDSFRSIIFFLSEEKVYGGFVRKNVDKIEFSIISKLSKNFFYNKKKGFIAAVEEGDDKTTSIAIYDLNFYRKGEKIRSRYFNKKHFTHLKKSYYIDEEKKKKYKLKIFSSGNLSFDWTLIHKLYIGANVNKIYFIKNMLIVICQDFEFVNLQTLKTFEMIDPLDLIIPYYSQFLSKTIAIQLIWIENGKFLMVYENFGFFTDGQGKSTPDHRVFIWTGIIKEVNIYRRDVVSEILGKKVEKDWICCISEDFVEIWDISTGEIVFLFAKKNLKFAKNVNFPLFYDEECFYSIGAIKKN